MHLHSRIASLLALVFCLFQGQALAVRKFGERRISFSGSHETLDVLEAYTLQPDGTKVPLELDQICMQWFGCWRLWPAGSTAV